MGKGSSCERIDKLLVDRGLVKSRERAKALLMAGRVLVDGKPVTKPGTRVSGDARIELRGEDIPYVSRGGLKLEKALKHFRIDVKDKVCVDIGASTGGFTHCLLLNGAKKVYAVDVGYGVLDWKLRNDPRVVVLEKTNIRHMPRSAVADRVDFVCVDVSFISLEKVLPKVKELLEEGGECVVLVKPQFEVGREKVSRGGIVREEAYRQEAVEKIKKTAQQLGFSVLGVTESPIKGAKGNVEYLMHLRLNKVDQTGGESHG
ncbi:MAG: TlyA family RNA methyltransferase [Deferribacteres bacterium]|nr:TlyA family RNA methyltransferase [Deferribacteres bacterium]